MKRKKTSPLNPRKCTGLVRAIQDILYLDRDEKGIYYNGSKEWSVDMLEVIAGALETVIPRPAEPSIRCIFCRKLHFDRSITLDRDRQPVCDRCWDERLR